MCGLSIAATMRAVMSLASIRNLEWTLATTTSSSPNVSRVQIQRTVLEDVDLHPRQEPERRQLLVHLGHHLELLAQALLVEPVRHGETGRVVRQHQIVAPEVTRRLGHLEDRAAAVGPVRM